MLLLAVSGGIDSMYLLNRAGDFFPGEPFAVAHCNFGLRGAESDGDEEFVRARCAERGVEFICRRFDTSLEASRRGASIEMAARDLRYAWFAELCSERGFRAVAVAHNANDNAETLLLNLLRGTGSRGVRGMSEDSCLASPAVRILRPMLGITREEIVSWMKERGLSWREDSSNSASDVKRNKLRNLVFPVLRDINPSFIQTLASDMGHLRDVDDIAEDCFRQAEGRILREEGVIDVRALLAEKHWKYLLFRLLERCNLSEPTFGKLTDLLERYRDGALGTVTLSGKVFESPTHIISAVRKTLVFSERK